jgi:hypothetical protein
VRRRLRPARYSIAGGGRDGLGRAVRGAKRVRVLRRSR